MLRNYYQHATDTDLTTNLNTKMTIIRTTISNKVVRIGFSVLQLSTMFQ